MSLYLTSDTMRRRQSASRDAGALRSFVDVSHLNPKLTTAELQARYGDDPAAFSLIVVAEAVQDHVPANITAWLRQPANSGEWVETLLHNEGVHQLAWWTRTIRCGPHSDTARRAHATLSALRARLPEARACLQNHLQAFHTEPAEAAALNRLQQAHRDEFEVLIARNRDVHNIVTVEPATAETRRLLALDERAFREVVAGDVKGDTVEALSHPAVRGRWHDVLVDLAVSTLTALELPLPPLNGATDAAQFAVADDDLPHGWMPSRDIDVWSARLTFLIHVRLRLTERARLRRIEKREVSEKVFRPAEDELRRRHFAEYARYRVAVRSDGGY